MIQRSFNAINWGNGAVNSVNRRQELIYVKCHRGVLIVSGEMGSNGQKNKMDAFGQNACTTIYY